METLGQVCMSWPWLEPLALLPDLQELARRELLPDLATYNELISFCSRGKHPERALSIFQARLVQRERQVLRAMAIVPQALPIKTGNNLKHAWNS